MPIRSPYNSFVDFNTDPTDCDGQTRQAALPVISDFSAKFQIKVDDELMASDTMLYAGICSEDCELLYDPNYEVIPICTRYKFIGTGSHEISDEDFPLTISNYAPQGGQPEVPAGVYTRDEFLRVVSDTYGTELPALDFINCCEMPVITGIVVFYSGGGPAREVDLNIYYGYGYVDFPDTSMSGIVDPGECFRYCILDESKTPIACSNLFRRETNDCYTSVINYYNEGNGYGFKYVTYDDNGTTKFTQNQIRVPFYLRRPGFTATENIFRRSDGVKQRLSTVVEKDWLGTVGYLSDLQHEKLAIALKHDVVNISNPFSNVNQRMTQEGAYTIGFAEELNSPLNPAEFRITDYSHNYVNNNCGFECGIEIIEDCEGGGVTPACPDRFQLEFMMANDQVTYQNDNLIGLTADQIEVYREGLIQYTVGANYYSLNSATGVITFVPSGYAGERIAIVQV